MNYGSNGYMCFDKLWELLIERGLNKQWLRSNGIHSNTVAKLAKNENVTCDVLCTICDLLNCNVDNIMEYKNK